MKELNLQSDNALCNKLGATSRNPMRQRKQKRVRLIEQFKHKDLEWLEGNLGLHQSTIMAHCVDFGLSVADFDGTHPDAMKQIKARQKVERDKRKATKK